MIEDLSIGGACLTGNSRLVPGEQIQIAIDHASTRWFLVAAQVTRVAELDHGMQRVALEFAPTPRAIREAIQRVLALPDYHGSVM